jgi:hypothetical protein
MSWIDRLNVGVVLLQLAGLAVIILSLTFWGALIVGMLRIALAWYKGT